MGRWFAAVSMAIFLIACSELAALSQQSDKIVVLETTRGPITLRVYSSIVPYTAGRFLYLVDNQFYDGLTFHRVENWVIQGGDPNGNGSGGYVDPNTGAVSYLQLECHRALTHNRAGMLAMARSASPNSASCQFYITKRPMPQLNGKYAVFGELVDGASVVMNIGPGDRILSAHVVEPGQQQQQRQESGWSGGGASAEAVPEVQQVPPAQLPVSTPVVPPAEPAFSFAKKFNKSSSPSSTPSSSSSSPPSSFSHGKFLKLKPPEAIPQSAAPIPDRSQSKPESSSEPGF